MDVLGPRPLGLRHVVQLRAVVLLVYEGAYHVGLVASGVRLANGPIGQVHVLRGDDPGGNARARAGPVANLRAGYVPVKGQCQRARDGRGRHGQQVRPTPLHPQGSTLVDAKAVLLVYDHQRQAAEGQVVREDGRRPEDAGQRPVSQAGGNLRALRGRRGARHQRPRDVRRVQQRAELLRVLAREHRGGGHHGRLRARVRHGCKGDGGHGRLARAHVTQEQAVHDLGRRHVAQYVRRRALLLLREREGQGRPQGRHVRPVRHVALRPYALQLHELSRAQGQLQGQELVVGKPPPGLLRGCLGLGKVHLAYRTREAHEVVARHQARRHRVAHVAAVRNRGRDYAPHPRCSDALPHRVDGQHAGVAARSVIGAQNLVEGRLHLLEAVGEGDLAGERDPVALVHLLRNPGLAEEGGHYEPRGVHGRYLHDLHAWLGPLQVHAVNRRNNGRVHAHVRPANGQHVGEVQVTAGQVQEEVAHPQDAQPL